MSQTYQLFARRYPGATSHVPFLAPWWGAPLEDVSSLHRGQFVAWAAAKPIAYVLVDDPAKADVFVLSIPWKLTRSDPSAKVFAEAEILAAKKHGCPIVIFFDSDHDDVIDWPEHAVIFRFSIYRDTRRRNEFSIPTFSQDFLALTHGGVLRTREKTTVPSVGFCGYAPPLGCHWSKRTMQEILRYAAYRVGALSRRRHLIAHAPRVQALRVLQRTSGVESRFIVRDQFAFNRWGVLQPGGTPESAARQRAEFIANLDESDYTVCARGLANCSIRFYEAISLGRLPLFIDTQCVLPYDWIVDWKQIGVWVDESELDNVGSLLRERYTKLPSEEYIAQQQRARSMFETWISPEGFFSQLYRHFPTARSIELSS